MYDLIRYIDFVTASLLLLVTVIGVIITWRMSEPSGRLFGLGLSGLLFYVAAAQFVALDADAPISWVAYIPPVPCMWLIGAVISITIEKRHEALQLSNERRDHDTGLRD